MAGRNPSAESLKRRLDGLAVPQGHRPAMINTLRPENLGQAPATVPAARDLKQDLLAYLHSLLKPNTQVPDIRSVTAM